MLACPFCGAKETDRFEIDGQRFLVFGCMFTPSVDPALSDAEAQELLASEYGPQGSAYFRGICDRLHRIVTQRPGSEPPEASETE